MSRSALVDQQQHSTGHSQPQPTNPFVRFSREQIGQSITARFETIAADRGDELAVKSASHALTYTELNAAANRIAHLLLARDAPASEPVALFAEMQIGTIAGLLGTLKAGRICVPVDSSLPVSRIEQVLEDSGAGVVVASDRDGFLADRLRERRLKVIDIDKVEPDLPKEDPGRRAAADAAAWILYTSSSTGDAKGVLQTHRDELHNVMNMTNSQHLCAADRMTLLRPPSVAGAIRNLLSAILNGSSLFLYDIRAQALSGLGEWLRRERITVYHSSASVFRKFVGTLRDGDVFPDVRLIRLGSEPVTWNDVESHRRHFPSDSLLVNALSSTEAKTFMQYFVGKNTVPTHDILPVGCPVEDVEIRLLDELGRQVEPGQIGEIAIRSRYLFAGYWGRPKLTRERLLPDGQQGEVRVFHTGDLGRMLPDGTYECRGRTDYQVKIRGRRIQLEAIERELCRIPGVAEAIAAAQDWHGDKRLVAFLVPREGYGLDPRDFRQILAPRIPDFMIPSAYTVVPALPKTTSGKVDRKALARMGMSAPEAEWPPVAEGTPVEQVLAQLWAEALGVSRIAPHEAFLDLGGNSLLATAVVSKINSIFSVHLSPPDVLQASDLGTLERALTKQLDPALATRIAQTWLEIGAMTPEEVREAIGEKSTRKPNVE